MPSNESGGADGQRLLVALEDGTGPLAEAIENGDPEQLQHWYELLTEISAEALLDLVQRGQLSDQDQKGIFRAVHLLMQWEHTQAEELKELVERETVGMAEREENWAIEREALRAELSSMRERITARAGVDNVHEAFRAEIDALAAENAQLKQLGRDRDRELAEQRDRADEMESRLHAAERERTLLLLANQAQLEESIRELNRRLSTRSEASQRDQEWESRKLRQRNEQALVLGEQVRELAAQNDELRGEVGRVTRALEEATELLRDNGRRFAEFDQQFGEAEKQIHRLGTDNRELRALLAEREKELKQRAETLEVGNREMADLMQAKETLVERLRTQAQKQKNELDQLRMQLQHTQPDEQKEAELERLRLELVSATETARRLFGAAMDEEEEAGMAAIAGARAEAGKAEPGLELRLRLVQMDRELEQLEAQLREEKRRSTELESAVEQKDLQSARLLADCQRYRKIAFGDADAEMQRIERQLGFRDRQIQQLTKRCSELQFDLEQMEEKLKKTEGIVDGEEEQKEERRDRERERRKKVTIRVEEEEEETQKMQGEVEQQETEYRIEAMESEEEERDEEEEAAGKEQKTAGEEKEATAKEASRSKKPAPVDRRQLLREATQANLLHNRISQLIQELEEREKQLDQLGKLHAERGRQLLAARQSEANARQQFDKLKEVLLFGVVEATGEPAKDALDKLDGDEGTSTADGGEEAAESPFAQLRSAERLEALQLENMELRRLADSVAQSGDERERRMAEATRRLLYLAVREAKLERRVEIGKRLRQTMADELARMRTRLGRVMTGQESLSRQLALENEAKLFELARLQNALLHSVPLAEHRRLLREHKQLLRDRLMPTDAGYHSVAEETEEEEDTAVQQLDISRSGLLFSAGQQSGDALMLKCRRLQELNDVLTGQNDSLRNEQRKLEAELAELNAFLDDLEAETELKSMLANIERRFVQALREQFDAGEERESLQRALGRAERDFREARTEWLAERQGLVQAIGRLHAALQKLARDRVQQPPISTGQLQALANRLREMRELESELGSKEAELVAKLEAVEQRERAEQARRAAMDTLEANDWQLAHVEASLQGYQLNVLTVGAELRKSREKLGKTERQLLERTTELDGLRQTVADLQFVDGIDLKMLEQKIANTVDGTNATVEPNREAAVLLKRPAPPPAPLQNDVSSTAAARNGNSLAELSMPSQATKVVVLNNSAEWEEQLRLAREQARLIVDSYKEQLERKEKTLEEYRALVEQLKAELTSKEVVTKGREGVKAKVPEAEEERRPKSSEELLAEQSRTEQWERRIRAMDSRLRMLETENAELETERASLVELLRRRSAGKEQRNAQVQADLTVPMPMGAREEKRQRKLGTVGGGVSRERGNGKETTGKKKRQQQQNGQQQEKETNTRRAEWSEEEEEEGGAASAASSPSASSAAEGEGEKREEEEETEEDGEADEGEEDRNGRRSSGSDSGTVEDFEHRNGQQQQQQQRRLGGRRSNSVGQQSRSSAGTRTMLPPRGPAAIGGQGTEQLESLVLKHRNETRRLRMRLIELERRNKELSEQYTSLRERSREAARPRSSAIDSATAEGTLRRENERLQRLNKNLRKSAEQQKTELEELQKRLTRAETQSRAGAQLWDERKRHEQAMAAARKRLADAEALEGELRTRLERQERHIEQLGREKAGRLADGDRLQAALRHWRQEKAELEQRVKLLGDEKLAVGSRCAELMARLEALARENRTLHKRLESVKQKEQKLADQLAIHLDGKPPAAGKTAQTQTPTEKSMTALSPPAQSQRRSGSRIRSAPTSTTTMGMGMGPGSARPPSPAAMTSSLAPSRSQQQTETARSQQQQQQHQQKTENSHKRELAEMEQRELRFREENQSLTKRLRRAELLQQETTEQLETLRKAHAQLLEDYNGMVRLGRELELKRGGREEEEAVGLALLRDKLEARERELDMQRHRIMELERHIWDAEMRRGGRTAK